MSDEFPGAAELLAEIEATPTELLQAVARSGMWDIHPLRVRLDTAERLEIARRAIVDLDRIHARELWREGKRVTTEEVTERRLEALAQAWARLGGGREFLFHVRHEQRRGEDRPMRRAEVEARDIEIDPSPGVSPAPYLEHPISLAEAARFAIVLPVLRCAAELGAAAVRAFDALGQPTAALHWWATRLHEPPRRRIVWRLRSAARGARSRMRMVGLAIRHVLNDLGEEGTAERFGVPAVAMHHEYWGAYETAAIGALAWRRARELDVQVRPPRWPVGNRMIPNPGAIGRSYRELEDPFAPLLALRRLGCRLHAFSAEATTLELQPLG